jgi:co-chaperonin GroES (HSP10)
MRANNMETRMLTPIAKRILVKPVEVKHGTLIVTNQKPVQFTVIAIGDEVTKVKIGDIIYLEKHYGVIIEHESEKYSVIDESSILAKLD